ncbi:single-stranded DNA-binding protein [Streptomyces decoyicus]|uniref:single-stranded DNA-binding protein n=1 Tax=Streptomyces decoyicus TaxID=249567 RepID=UPI0038646998|nr:single-stranded DNA-binding protein [Streptomyces decoyicus]
MNDTMVTLVGNAATAVEHRQTTAGVTVARFRLAATSRRWDKAQERWTDGGTSFYTVRSWRALADNVAASVAVGEPLVVQGRLRLREGEQPPERGGQRWFSAEVDAVAIGHDLARGTSAFRRATRAARTEADPTPSPSPQPSPRSPHETSERHETSGQHESSQQHETSEEHKDSEQHEAGEEMLPVDTAPALGKTADKTPVKRRSRARTSTSREPREAPVTAASSATHSSQKAAVP